MKTKLSILTLASLLSAAGAAAPAVAQSGRDLSAVLAEIDQGFVCPQFRPDDEARRADMVAFSRSLATVGPRRISYRQAAYIRAKMLERHNCGSGTPALANLAAGAQPAGVIEAGTGQR